MAQRVVVDPYVALSILDHYMRRSEPPVPEQGKPQQPDRVTGIILGSTVKSEIFVKSWAPSMDISFVDLIQRSAPTELGLGWYTSQFLPASDLEGVHQKLKEKGMAKPLILTMSVPDEHSNDVVFRAFQTTELTLADDQKAATAIREIPCVVQAIDNTSNVAIDTMASQLYPEAAKASDPARLPASSPTTDAFAELRQMRANLQVARDYVNDALNGKRPVEKQTCRALHELLVTDRVQAASADVVREKLQDTVMLMHLSRALERQVERLMEAAPLQTRP